MNRDINDFCFWFDRYLEWIGFACEFSFTDRDIVVHLMNTELEAKFLVPKNIVVGYPREVAESKVVVGLIAVIKERIYQSNLDYEVGCAVDDVIGHKEL